MTALKKVHFGERLLKVIEAKYKTQTDFAKKIKRSQPTVARWVGKAEFATSDAVRKVLIPLQSEGIIPEYFWNPAVTDWRGPIITDVDEGALLRMRLEAGELRKEVMRLREENKKLLDYIEELTQK